MTAKTELLSAIDKIVYEKTFTMEGLQAINGLREKAEKLENELITVKDRIKNGTEENSRLNRIIASSEKEKNNVNARELAVTEREKKQLELEIKAATSDARAATIATCFDGVFRNAKIREQVFRSDVIMRSDGTSHGGYPQTVQNTDNVTRTEE